MSEEFPEAVATPTDALLMCDYMARFGIGDCTRHFAGIATVIRDLMRRLEEQAMRSERIEASRREPS